MDGERRLLTGTAEELRGDVKQFEDRGVHNLSIMLLGVSLDKTLDNMDRFADQIMSKI